MAEPMATRQADNAIPGQFTYRVLLFGQEAVACAKAEVLLTSDVGARPVAELRGLLAQAEPALARFLGSARFAVDHAFVKDSAVVRPDDEIALIGLVSGG